MISDRKTSYLKMFVPTASDCAELIVCVGVCWVSEGLANIPRFNYQSYTRRCCLDICSAAEVIMNKRLQNSWLTASALTAPTGWFEHCKKRDARVCVCECVELM